MIGVLGVAVSNYFYYLAIQRTNVATDILMQFFFSSRRRHTRSKRDWSSDVCSSDLTGRDDADVGQPAARAPADDAAARRRHLRQLRRRAAAGRRVERDGARELGADHGEAREADLRGQQDRSEHRVRGNAPGDVALRTDVAGAARVLEAPDRLRQELLRQP